ncbi:hypothetical protein GcM1_241045 [Golovinomyces cichoracearum]|uniref:Uncharacterized protein n=1 Tax=Golovinomyces cichoracearum TaxID=62708 RepID=A0A420IHM8_9PEZI|nr:hypothetical protein GcM1_241045 [Golovinomyces cichoracearum]
MSMPSIGLTVPIIAPPPDISDAFLFSKSYHDIVNSVVTEYYRPDVLRLSKKCYDLTMKIENVRRFISTLEEASAKGPIPPFMQGTIKIPKIQFTKEFEFTPAHQNATHELSEDVKQMQKSMIWKCIEMKTTELESLKALNVVETLVREGEKEIDSIFTNVSSFFNEPSLSMVNDYVNVKRLLPLILNQTKRLAANKVLEQAAVRTRKAEKKIDIGVVMGNAPSDDLISYIRSEVAKHLKLAQSNKIIPKDHDKSRNGHVPTKKTLNPKSVTKVQKKSQKVAKGNVNEKRRQTKKCLDRHH